MERKRKRSDTTAPSRLLDAVGQSGARTWFAVWALTLVIFAVTSHWWTGQVSDAIAASWPAWQLAHHGTLDLSGATGLPNVAGFLDFNGSVVVQRNMGVVLIAVPLNLLLGWTPLTAVQVGALTASLVTAVAVANVALVLRTLTSPRRAILGALLLAFGTGMWTVASAELWTHGPTTMWLSLGLVFLSRERLWLAGCALAPSITTRPHLSIAIAIMGLWIGWARRSLRPIVALGVPACVAVAVLVAWNAWYFGTPSIGGPYIGAIGVAARPLTEGLSTFAVAVAGTLVSGWCGVLLFSPVIIALAFALPAGWRAAPAYARGAMLGGLAYLAIQLRVDTFTGGGTFFGNRLVLELIVLSTPLFAVGYARWADGRPWRVTITTSFAAVSIGIHATGVLLADYRVGGSPSPWTTWYPEVVVRAAGSVGLLVVAIVLLAVLFSVLESVRTAVRISAAVPSGSLVGDLPDRRSSDVTGDKGRLELEQPRQQTVDKAR